MKSAMVLKRIRFPSASYKGGTLQVSVGRIVDTKKNCETHVCVLEWIIFSCFAVRVHLDYQVSLS